MTQQRKPLFRDIDMGDGFKITAVNRRTWTEYQAAHLDGGGYVIARRFFSSCYRKEADAKIAQWKAEDASKSSAA